MAKSVESLICPITLELFRDPVLAQDGYTYEKVAIENWIKCNGTSPKTGEQLSLEHLYPNHIVKQLVSAFEKSLVEKNFQFVLNVDVRKKKGRPLFQTTGKTIYLADWLPTNSNRPDIIILKIDGARAMKEASFYVNLSRHPHVLRTFGFVLDRTSDDNDENNENNSIMLVQEYAPEGSLFELVQDRGGKINEKIFIEIFLQIIDAMIFLAYNHVVHGDLACRNVLVFRFDEKNPKNIIVKVTDFGLSRQSTLYSKTVGSARATTLDIIPTRYAAPEILSEGLNPSSYTEKSDVYSMGVLMWEAYSRGNIPWSKIEKDAEVIHNVMNSILLPQPSKCSSKYWNIITKTWCKSPRDRPTFKQLKQLFIEQIYLPGDNSSENQTTTGLNNTFVKPKDTNEKLTSRSRTSSAVNLPNKDLINSSINCAVQDDTTLQNSLTTTPTVSITSLDKKKEYVFKILVIGEMGTGKTAFIKRYVENYFSKNYQATIGLDFALKILKYDDNTIIRLQFWDIGGQERISALTRAYYKDAVGCLVVFEVTRQSTFTAVMRWKSDLDNKVHLPDGNPIPCVLLANKCDLPKEDFMKNTQKMDEFCRENGFMNWFETSAKEFINIDTSIQFLINEIMNHVELIPSRPLLLQRSDTINIADKLEKKPNDGRKSSWCSLRPLD